MQILSVYPLPGISYTHDASVCLVDDKGVRFAAEEERFLRAQHAIGQFPERSVMMALRQSGLRPADISHLAVASIERCDARPDYQARLQFAREIAQIPGEVPVSCVPHHLAHSASSVLTSPFESCVFLTLDGGGDGSCGHWGMFENGEFRICDVCSSSPAVFYSYLTGLCGFPAFEEGKTMGLAAYGERHQRLWEYFAGHFRIAQHGINLETDLTLRWEGVVDSGRVNPDAFARHKYLRWHLHFDGNDDTSWMREIAAKDIARTGQEFFQELLNEILSNVLRRTGETRVAASGGAFLNVAASGWLRRQHPSLDLHVPMAPHDAGLAMGAALLVRHLAGGLRLAAPVSPFLGPSFTAEDVEAVIREFGVPYSRPDGPGEYEATVASLIGAGKIVGWFEGRAESGARALGGRSVLGDPRRADIKARLNLLLKKRDWFMPFAPSMLEEAGPDYFDRFAPSPYMNLAQQVRPERSGQIPAAVHVDGSCRVHTVAETPVHRYRRVLTAFRDLTGIPLVLNTSFNRHGLPMVATPRQAVHLLLEGCVDVLAIEGFVVERPIPA